MNVLAKYLASKFIILSSRSENVLEIMIMIIIIVRYYLFSDFA